jgi:hypothetical protein
MPGMETVELIRWTNVVFGGICLLWMGIRSAYRWGEYPYTLKLFLLTLSFYVFGVTIGSAEAAVQNAAAGGRTYVYLLSNVALFVTLAMTQKRRVITVRT